MFMEWLYAVALNFLLLNIRPLVCFRYLDDVIEAIRKDRVDQLTSHLNNQNPNIKFTVELQGEDKVETSISPS